MLPLGLDHILFVIGLFFLSRKWKPIIYQVSVFTLAHTITLGLATLDLVSAPSNVVEPVIVASIAIVAIENILFPGYRHLRLLVVFFFGLIHGLGFAGALSAFQLDPASLMIGLLGFNVGVELGQLAVISLVFTATFWLKEEHSYRKFAVIPGSSFIAIMGFIGRLNEFSFSDLIMLNHLFKKFQLVIASIAMIASTSLPLGVLQIGVWANMFEQFYEETRSVFLSAEWTFDGDHRCSGCQLVSDLGAKTKESLKSSSLSIENQLSVPVASKISDCPTTSTRKSLYFERIIHG